MSDIMIDLPQAETADPDGVQMALRAAQTLWSRGDTTESLRWLRRAAESASDEGADLRSFQLAKAAAELRGKLFGSSDAPVARSMASGEDASGLSPSEPFEAAASAAPSSPVSEVTRTAWSDESPAPGSGRPVTATQYPSQRPRQLMGLSPSTLETVAQRDSYSSVPSWSADSERRASAPPPLPHAAADEYEELEAEPDEEAAEALDRRRAPTLPPAAHRSSVPLPARAAPAVDADSMRPELPTVLLPPEDDAPSDFPPPLMNGTPYDSGALPDPGGRGWDSEASVAWGSAPRSSGWGGGDNRGSDAPAPLSELTQAKLTARVHHQAVRVSFAPDLRAPGQYVVRPLRAGEAAPAGERVALLVALEPGMPLV